MVTVREKVLKYDTPKPSIYTASYLGAYIKPGLGLEVEVQQFSSGVGGSGLTASVCKLKPGFQVLRLGS